jgi:predicted Zn-dependent protease with MMP-like domain
VTLAQFEAAARNAWARIPESYKAGIDAMIVEADAHSHPEHDDFFTLGECITETYPSEFGGPDTIRSAVVLYYGSFASVAAEDEQFPWQQEIEETLLHELQHHLEHLADADELEDFDHAVEENFKRVEGEPFDPLFFRVGRRIGEGIFRVEHDVFVEVSAADASEIEYDLAWADQLYRVSIPQFGADVLYAVIDQEMPEVQGDLCIVRVRRMSMLGTLRAALGGRGYSVGEVFVEAVRQ